jgi:hypothetical protein
MISILTEQSQVPTGSPEVAQKCRKMLNLSLGSYSSAVLRFFIGAIELAVRGQIRRWLGCLKSWSGMAAGVPKMLEAIPGILQSSLGISK